MNGFVAFFQAHTDWSFATFGGPLIRPPAGALRHLAKETEEVIAAFEAAETRERIAEELADCLLLLCDASRRCGIGPRDLLKAAWAKLAKNRQRRWPPRSEQCAGEPTEHLRDGE